MATINPDLREGSPEREPNNFAPSYSDKGRSPHYGLVGGVGVSAVALAESSDSSGIAVVEHADETEVISPKEQHLRQIVDDSVYVAMPYVRGQVGFVEYPTNGKNPPYIFDRLGPNQQNPMTESEQGPIIAEGASEIFTVMEMRRFPFGKSGSRSLTGEDLSMDAGAFENSKGKRMFVVQYRMMNGSYYDMKSDNPNNKDMESYNLNNTNLPTDDKPRYPFTDPGGAPASFAYTMVVTERDALYLLRTIKEENDPTLPRALGDLLIAKALEYQKENERAGAVPLGELDHLDEMSLAERLAKRPKPSRVRVGGHFMTAENIATLWKNQTPHREEQYAAWRETNGGDCIAVQTLEGDEVKVEYVKRNIKEQINI
jgi:hypothetical protein